MFLSSPPVPLQGGLDLVTPPMLIPPGRVIQAKNYEAVQRGYQRMDGYERFDGHPKPSAASYWVLYFTNGTAAFAVGNTVTGATSGATGIVNEVSVVNTGSYGGSNAAGYCVLIAVTGIFITGENLQVSSVTKCHAAAYPGGVLAGPNGMAIMRGAPNDTLDMTYYQDAVTTTRTAIAAIPGAGNVLGVWVLNGVKYGFRNKSDNTVCQMWKATTSGWTLVALGSYLSFTGATTGYTPQVGDTITGATSAATGVIAAIAITRTTGTWSTNATGRFIFSSTTGTFNSSENVGVGGHSSVAAVQGPAVLQTIGQGGKLDFVSHNFTGTTFVTGSVVSGLKMYGANGAGYGFEFDGTTFVSILTGMVIDHPKKVSVFANQLFFAFYGGSLQNSGIGQPYVWSVIVGANEIAIGDEINALSKEYVGTLYVIGDNKISALTGTSVLDFVLVDVTTQGGGQEWTAQLVDGPVYVDEAGIRSIATTAAYGNFNLGTLSQLVQPLFQARVANSVTPVGSCVVRGKDQYRVFYSDNSFSLAYFSKTNTAEPVVVQPGGWPVPHMIPEVMNLVLSHNVKCVCSCDDPSQAVGTDITLFGDDQGFVYEMDRGTSHDGGPVEAWLQLPWYFLQSQNSPGSPTVRKAWKKATLEIDTSPTATIYVSAEFSYGDPDELPAGELQFSIAAGGGVWDISQWDQFFWSQPQVGRAVAAIPGTGTNVSLSIYSNSTWDEPHTIHGVTYGYAPRGPER